MSEKWLNATILLVHLGSSKPRWLIPSIRALQTCHGPTSVAVLAESSAVLRDAEKTGAAAIHYSSTRESDIQLARALGHSEGFRSGFWLHSTRRLMALAEASRQLGGPLIHVETDVIALRDLRLTGKFLDRPIAFPILSQGHGSGSVIYVRDLEAAHWLREQTMTTAARGRATNDMQILWHISKSNPEMVQELPSVSQDTGVGRQMVAQARQVEPNTGLAASAQSTWGIFDSAAIGQFLLGPDPRNNRWGMRPIGRNYGPASSSAVVWSQLDLDEVSGLFWIQGLARLPVITLHVHSKDLRAFNHSQLTKLLRRRIAARRTQMTWDPWAFRQNTAAAVVRRLP